MTSSPAHRRRFLKTAGAIGAAALSTTRASFADAGDKPAASELIPGKDARLKVHGASPGEIETPLELLREHRITPEEILFVRNNQRPAGAMTLEPLEDPDWSVEIVDLRNVADPFNNRSSRIGSFTIGQLGSWETIEREFVLQCSGNDRSRFKRAATVEGVPWGSGAVANVKMKGVRLATIFKELGITPDPGVKFVTVEGQDRPELETKPDFEHSIPLGDALERSFLATHLNGKPLARVHGGPLRFITPGYYGTMHVKWTTRLRLEAGETANYHHAVRYRTPLRPIPPGSNFSPTLANSEPNWNMKIKSTIFSPLPQERLSADKPISISGVAWNDGQAKIVAVEISTDGKRTWRRVELDTPADPYAWYTWKTNVSLPAGRHVIYSRAHDALGRTQPLDGTIHWTPPGYCWNGIGEVEFEMV